jgi:2-polyprenyl-3-methyl-5-hydroxy-6-metoxy-1,4-benzoquinol methylase
VSVTLSATVSMPTGGPDQGELRANACLACGAALLELPSIVGGDRLLATPGAFEVRVCPRCGAGRTGPPASASELSGFYGDGYGAHEDGASDPLAIVLRRLKRVQSSAILTREPFSSALGTRAGRALDVGCGRGDLAGALIARGWRVGGIEPSARAAAIAERRGVEIVGATLEAAGLDGGYDLVVLRHSLEHLPDPVGDLRRVREALRPGGRVVISVPNFASWQRRRFGADWFHLDLPRHRTHFTAASLRWALNSADLEIGEQFTSTSVLGLAGSLQYAAFHRCLAPGGARLRLLGALCCAVFPATWLADRLGGEADTLHVIARGA